MNSLFLVYWTTDDLSFSDYVSSIGKWSGRGLRRYLRSMCLYVLQTITQSQSGKSVCWPRFQPGIPRIRVVSYANLVSPLFTAKGVLARDARIANYVFVNYKNAVRQSPCTLVEAELDKKCPAMCGTRRAHPSLPRSTRISFLGGRAAGTWGLQLTYGTEEYVELFFNYLIFLYLVLRS